MKGWGIRARVLFVALVPSVLILFVLVIYFTYTRIVEVDVSLAHQGKSVARQLAPGAEFALFAGDRVALQRLTDAAAREANVSGITITDGAGRALAASKVDDTNDRLADTIEFMQPVFETRLAADIPDQLHVPAAAAVIGRVTVVMSRRGARAEQNRLLATGLVLGLACLGGATLLAMAIGESVIRPIRTLAGAMRELGGGRRIAPLAVAGGSELRTLQEGFNEMSMRLHASTQELQQRIEGATHALLIEKQTAEQATADKSRFIAAASHDLRQPLHAIGMFSATLQRRCRGLDVAGVADDLAEAVGVMDKLFDSLLDISKFDAGVLRAEPKPVRLARLFLELSAEHHDVAVRKGLTLRFRPTSAVVMTDELLLRRLLGNLIANAIRYTSAGSVLIGARPRGDFVQIEVRDSGAGIAPEHVDKIFGEFYQVGNPARDRDLGLGLGLAIVSRIARLLDADVQVRSAPERGSIFSLRLPRIEPQDMAPGMQNADADACERPAAFPVLVIDDDRLVLAGSRALLEDLGCRVATASDAVTAEAVMRAASDPAMLVLCDVGLAGEDNGVVLLRRLAAITRTSICGILVSGDTRPETIQLAKNAGYELLHKPISPARLRAVVTHFSLAHASALEAQP
jgi:two-component system, sensor histidine kinase